MVINCVLEYIKKASYAYDYNTIFTLQLFMFITRLKVLYD